MDFENERQVISARFQTFWENMGTDIIPTPPPIAWNNKAFTQPTNEIWARFTLLPVTTKPASIGKTRVRSTSIMAVQIFTPGTGGTGQARTLADAIAEEFDDLCLQCARGYIYFQTLETEDYGHTGGFHQFNANVPFWRDTKRTAPQDVDGGTFLGTPHNNVDGGGF